MADSNYGDYVRIGRRIYKLPLRVPNRYLRTILVTRGFWDGYEEVLDEPPRSFHFLGLGAPIMMAIVAATAVCPERITFDATSPIKDAVEGMLYVAKPAYLKVRIRKVAYRLAGDKRRRWDCPCPFCQRFIKNHPFDYDAGSRWLLSTGAKKVTIKDLKPGGGLYDAYPLFSEPASSDELRAEVNSTRIGHNHWALERLMASIQQVYRNSEKLHVRIRNIVKDYANHTTRQYSYVVKTSLLLSDRRIPISKDMFKDQE